LPDPLPEPPFEPPLVPEPPGPEPPEPEPPFEPEPPDPEPEPEPLEPEPEPEPPDPVPFDPEPEPVPLDPELPFVPLFPLSPLSPPPAFKWTVTGGGAPTTSGGPLVNSPAGTEVGEADDVGCVLDVGVIATAGAPNGCPASSAKLRPLVSRTAKVTHVPPTSPRTIQLAAPRWVADGEPVSAGSSRRAMVPPVCSVTLNCPL
jgi:hypothetical protein